MRKIVIAILSLLLLSLAACKKDGNDILNKESMAQLLVDVHKAEAVIALNYNKYPTDSAKGLLREAVFTRHNITKAQFDSSLVWYGNHIEEYMEVYDMVIAQLNEENDQVKKLIEQDNTQVLTRPGDTVDVWKQQRAHIFDTDKMENVWTFDINADENFFTGDRFILKLHSINTPREGAKPIVYLAVRHNEQNVHYVNSIIERDGWTEVKIQSDSASRISTVYGYIALPRRIDGHIMYVDSIALIRIHPKPGMPAFPYNIMETRPDRLKKRPGVESHATKATPAQPRERKRKNLIPQ